ncbi:MAG: LytTR family DNA-binding domain-containing protein [Bacilli bacterium]
MIKIFILEDDLDAIEQIKDYLGQYQIEKSKVAFNITAYPNPFDFLEKYTFDADIIFLDIEMPGMNGMEVAKKIRQKDAKTLIIFVTNLAQYAIEGYEVNAFDFILKPVHYPSFSLKLDRIINELDHRKNDKTISIQTKSGIKRILISDLSYVEVMNHDLIYHLSDEEIIVRGTISQAQKELEPYHFALCNSCYLVNLKFSTNIQDNSVVINNQKLPISKNKRKDFLEEIAAYYGGEN